MQSRESFPLNYSVGMHTSLQRLRNFSRRPKREKRLLLQAVAVVWGARLALSVMPNAFRRKWLHRSPAVRQPRRNGLSPREIADAIRVAARRMRGADCLAQALAARSLLARNGYAGTIRISVGRTEGDRFTAHAWIAIGDGDESFGPIDMSHRISGERADFEL